MEKMIDRIKNGKFTLLAEIGVNYYDIATKLNISLMDAAKFMILSAANAGVHGVKFQTYKAGSLAAKNSPYYWDINEEPTRSQYELFTKFDKFGVREYRTLSVFCNQIGVEFCSTPFDEEAADYLDDLMGIYKISSSDLTNLPFIEYMAKKKKPIILSVGAAKFSEMQQAIEVIRKNNQCELVLMHCVLEYPTPYDDANLLRIKALKENFENVYIGYSDHAKPDRHFDVIKTAYNLGAVLIEKHFTVDKSLKGNDHYHAMDAGDIREIIKQMEFVDSIRGSADLTYLANEAIARKNARRSLVTKCNISHGMVIEKPMLTAKRPGMGISPERINEVLGKKAKIDIDEDTIVTLDMFE